MKPCLEMGISVEMDANEVEKNLGFLEILVPGQRNGHWPLMEPSKSKRPVLKKL